MRHAPTLLFLFLSLLATAVYGEIYRSTDEQGQAVFSDAPKPGSTPVELAPTNTTPAVSPSTQPHSFPKVLGPAPNTLNIQQPGNGQVLPNGRTPPPVAVRLAQPLKDGQRIRIRVDGKVLSEGATTSTSIPFLHRGEHQISAELVDHNGRIVSRDQVTVISRWPNN